MPDTDDIDELLNEQVERQRKEERALRLLLDQRYDRQHSFLAVSCKMGDSTSYISSVPLSWFAGVMFASDLEIFDEHKDENAKSIHINESTLDVLSQRTPDWSRQIDMTLYLAVRAHRKFPPALLVAYQDWVFDKNHDNWMNGQAIQDSVTRHELDSHNWVVDLRHEHTRFYALDGQHRLMAAQGLQDLIKHGKLQSKKKDNTITDKAVSIEDVFNYCREDGMLGQHRELEKLEPVQALASIMDEQIGVEIIPAVLQGETLEKAYARLRQIFVDVNQSAKKLEKGELALIDENDGFSIVARKVMVSHDLFAQDNELRVDTKSNQLKEKSEDYTTLRTIAGIARAYLGQQNKFFGWKGSIGGFKGAGKLRPSNEHIGDGQKQLSKYLDGMISLPSHKKMIRGKKVSELRASKKNGGEDNVLFRPIAQEALAWAVGQLVANEEKLEKIFTKICKKDDPSIPDLKLTDPASPFFGVLCEPTTGKMRRQEKYKKLAIDLFLYLLNGGISVDEDREKLKEKIFDSRRTTLDDAEDDAKAIGYDGKQVGIDKFDLPAPW